MIIVLIAASLNMIVRYLLSWSEMVVAHNLGIVLLAPLPICFFTVFYSKKVKEQAKIYFKEKIAIWD